MIHRTIYCRARYSPVTPIIRAVDGMGHWGHVAGILADGEHVIEARAFAGVVPTPLADVIRRSSAFDIVEREVPNKAAGDAWALSTVGAGYDWLGALGSPWGRDWSDPGQWYCSHHAEHWHIRSELLRWREGKRGVTPNEHYWAA